MLLGEELQPHFFRYLCALIDRGVRSTAHFTSSLVQSK